MNRELLNREMTFDNFVVGESNKFAHAISVAVSHNIDSSLSPLFIYGPIGCGKTHLLKGIENEIIKADSDIKVKYITADQFANDLIDAIRDERTSAFRNEYRNLDVLLFDDVQNLQGKETSQIEFFNTFEALFSSDKLIVVSGDDSPKLLENIDDRIKSRLAWNVNACIRKPEEKLKLELVELLADSNKSVDSRKLNKVIKIFSKTQFDNNAELKGAFNTVMAAIKYTDFDCAKENIEQMINKYTERCQADDLRAYLYRAIFDELGYSKKKYPTSREQSVIDFWFDVLMCSEDEVFEACRKARCIGATSIDVVDKIIKNE